MQWSNLLSFVLAASSVNALLRFGCSQLVIERFDPLLNPGVVSPHLHQIIGGNAFNITMDPNSDLFAGSTCTTCRFKEDTSNYWTAVMYYKHPNGSFHRVPQFANQYIGNPNGGMTVYYIQPFNGGKVTAPPKGFRMIVGDAMLRSMNQSNADARAISFRCWSANYGGVNAAQPPGTGPDTHNLPTKRCEGGIRANMYFPSCWDGKTLDPPDHKSHVAFPNGDPGEQGLLGYGGACPASHPVRLPQLFTETAWDTRQFNSMPWPSDGQPFVFSMGDPKGYGHHGDYVFGWQGDSLQRAMDKCTDISGGACNQLTQLSDAEINACSQASRVSEPVDGWINTLPGCNPVQDGPGRAVPQDDCGATTTYAPGGPAGPAQGGGSPAVSPPGGGGSQGGGGVTPPVTGGTPPATGGGGATVAHYGQCGGNGYTGATTCAAPYTCKKQNDWYSQCL